MSKIRVEQPGFAAASRKGRLKPFDERVQIAKVRILAAIEKQEGSINVRGEGDAVNFCVRHVHNRGRELGCYRNSEFRKVIIAALKQLCEDNTIVYEDPCRLRLNYRPTARRQHKQKYPAGGFTPHARTV